MLRLTIERDKQAAQQKDFAGSSVVVGRDDGLDLQLKREDGASRQHCKFTVEGRGVFVEDLGSSNGTKVNGKKIERRTEVKAGDEVLVGTVKIKAAVVAGGSAAVVVKEAAKPIATVKEPAKPIASAKVTVAKSAKEPAKPIATVKEPARPIAKATSKPDKAEPEKGKAAARVIVAPKEEPEEAPETARAPVAPREAGPVNDENEACRAEIDPLARRWRDLGRPAWALLAGDKLARGLRWMQSDKKLKPRPSEHHREFIVASRAGKRDRIQRTALVGGALVTTVVTANLTAHAVYKEIVLGEEVGSDKSQVAQQCSRNPATLEKSNKLAAKVAELSQAPEMATLVGIRALSLAEGACARYGDAERVLRNQLASQRSRVIGHKDGLGFRSVDIARDDEMVASVDAVGVVELWTRGTDGGPKVLAGVSGKATLAVLSPSDEIVAVGTDKGPVDLFTVTKGSKPTLLKTLEGHRDEITALAFSDEGSMLATADKRGAIRFWDMRGNEKGKERGELRDHRSAVTQLVFRNGNQRLYAVGVEAYAYDLSDGKRKGKPFKLGMTGAVTAMAVDVIGNEVFTADEHGEVLHWEIKNLTKATFQPVAKHDSAVLGLGFVSKDRALISLGVDKQLKVTEVDKKMREDEASLPMGVGLQGVPDKPRFLLIDPNGRRVAVSGAGGKIHVWDLGQRMTSAAPIAKFTEHADDIEDLAASRDGNWMMSAGKDGTLREWDLQNTSSGSGSNPANDHVGTVFDLALSADGTRMLSGGQDKQLRGWRIDPTGVPRLQIVHEVGAPIKTLALSPDGRWAAFGVEQSIRLLDMTVAAGDRKAESIERRRHNEVVRYLAFSPDRAWLVSADDAGVVNTWRMAEDGPEDEPVRSETTSSAVTALALSPTESLIAAASFDKVVRVWPLGGGTTKTQRTATHDAAVVALAWSPGTEFLISGSEDGQALLQRNTQGRLELDPEHASFSHQRPVKGLAFSTDKRWLATGSDDGVISVWSMDGRKAKQKDLTGHEGPIVGLAFDAGSELLISASRDKTVRLWRVGDLDIGGEVASMVLTGHGAPITTLRVEQGGRYAATAGEDGAIHLWPLQHGLLLRLACRVVGRDFTETEWSALFGADPTETVCAAR